MLLTLIATRELKPFLLEVRPGGGLHGEASHWSDAASLWPRCQTWRALPDVPHCPLFKHPLFFIILFYFPFLFVRWWKSLTASEEPGSALCRPPHRSPPHPPFLILPQWNEGSEGPRALRLFSSFKIRPPLPQICLFSPLRICVLSHRKSAFF